MIRNRIDLDAHHEVFAWILKALDSTSHHRRRLQSANIPEKLTKRSRVVGVFPSRGSRDRLLGTQVPKVHEQWSLVAACYLNMNDVDLAASPSPFRSVAWPAPLAAANGAPSGPAKPMARSRQATMYRR